MRGRTWSFATYSLSKNTAFPSSTFMETKSFTWLGGGATAAGKLTRIPFMWVWLRLTIIKLARRKNMTSINGMISMRALLCGIGEESLIFYIFVRQDSVRGTRHREGNGNLNFGNCSRLKSPLPKGADGCIIQYWVSNALRHGSTAYTAAP